MKKFKNKLPRAKNPWYSRPPACHQARSGPTSLFSFVRSWSKRHPIRETENKNNYRQCIPSKTSRLPCSGGEREIKGLILLEIIVTVALSGVLILGFVSFLFSLMKGQSKSEVIKEVKQNGDYAMFVMSEMIRNASSLTCGASCTEGTCGEDNITIKNPDRNLTTFSCSEETVDSLTVAKIASISAGLSGSLTEFLTGRKVTLAADNICSGTLHFDCTFPSNSPPKVTISFTLYQAGTVLRPEERASADFKTTVSLRTY